MTKMKNSMYILLVALIALSFINCGGTNSPDTNKDWQIYNIDNSNIVNDWIYCIVVDSQNNKWFGTKGGISMFNGSNWKNYYAPVNGLASNVVYCITVNADENIWAGTNRGISKLNVNANTWTTYTVANGLPSDEVRSIASDAQGNIWAGTNRGLAKFDGLNWTVITGSPDKIINSITIDKNNIKWFTTEKDGKIWSFDNSELKEFNDELYLFNTNITCVATDSKNNKWFSSNKFIGDAKTVKYDNSNWEYVEYLRYIDVNHISFDSQDNGWFSTNKGAYVLNSSNNNWTEYKKSNSGIASDTVTCIAIDKQGYKWFGSNISGVSVLKK